MDATIWLKYFLSWRMHQSINKLNIVIKNIVSLFNYDKGTYLLILTIFDADVLYSRFFFNIDQ